jgi:hypothetical protein
MHCGNDGEPASLFQPVSDIHIKWERITGVIAAVPVEKFSFRFET